MIRLRKTIERGVRHPVYGPLFVLLLCLMLALLALHTAHDGAHDAAFACIAIAFTFGAALIVRIRPPLGPLLRLVVSRGPPRPRIVPAAVRFLPLASPSPLRQ